MNETRDTILDKLFKEEITLREAYLAFRKIQAEEIVALDAKSLGSLGGNKRKETTTLEQRRAWGKLGGRPRKITN